MTVLPSKVMSYRPDLFVNRRAEIDLVKQMAADIRQGKLNEAGIAIFYGARGAGKTWLATHLYETELAEFPGVSKFFLRFSSYPSVYDHKTKGFINLVEQGKQNDFDYITQTIVMQIAQYVGAETTVDAPLRELTGWLARDVERRFVDRKDKTPDQDSMFVLILDSVFEADWALLAKLETYLLAPLANLPRMMIIMTGRGRLYPWTSPKLKSVYRPPSDTDSNHDEKIQVLEAFSQSDVREQVERLVAGKEIPQHVQNPQWTNEIIKLGGGLPLITTLLAHAPDAKAALNSVAEDLLNFIHPSSRKIIREYLEALSVLDGFREIEIAPMLKAYYDNPKFEHWSMKQVREEVREKLQNTNLLRWENNNFTIDRSIQTVLTHFLHYHNLETWQRLHCQAYRNYSRWAQEIPRLKAFYTGRAQFHAQALLNSDFDPARCFQESEPSTVNNISSGL